MVFNVLPLWENVLTITEVNMRLGDDGELGEK